jgi:hypothetical protein
MENLGHLSMVTYTLGIGVNPLRVSDRIPTPKFHDQIVVETAPSFENSESLGPTNNGCQFFRRHLNAKVNFNGPDIPRCINSLS